VPFLIGLFFFATGFLAFLGAFFGFLSTFLAGLAGDATLAGEAGLVTFAGFLATFGLPTGFLPFLTGAFF